MTDRVILGCTILIAVVYLYATTLIPSLEIGDPLGPKAFPRLLGIALLLAAGMLALEIWKRRKAKEPDVPAAELFDPVIIRILLCVVVWTAGYYAVFDPLGFIVATTHLPARPDGVVQPRQVGRQRAHRRRCFRWVSYVMFVKLDVNLPKGILPFWD